MECQQCVSNFTHIFLTPHDAQQVSYYCLHLLIMKLKFRMIKVTVLDNNKAESQSLFCVTPSTFHCTMFRLRVKRSGNKVTKSPVSYGQSWDS